MLQDNKKKGLRDILKGKGAGPKDALGSQLPHALLPPPLSPTTRLGLLPIPNLKKKRKKQELEEGEVVPPKGAKQQKMARDKQASYADNREEPSGADVHQQQHTWAPRLELEGAPIPWNSSIREFQRGHSTYVAKVLEQPLLLPNDVEALRHVWQLDLFMSPKRDLAMVSLSSYLLTKC